MANTAINGSLNTKAARVVRGTEQSQRDSRSSFMPILVSPPGRNMPTISMYGRLRMGSSMP